MKNSVSFKAIFMAALMTAGATTSINAQQAQGQNQPGNVMMVLDGSNSMWGQINGTAKISIAKEVMTDLITTWDPKAPLGMLVYGHRRKNDCKDVELISTPGLVDRKALINKVQSISPRGKTPISRALTTAAGFGGAYLGQKLDLVLVSDGLETCDADPCATAAGIKAFNTNFKAHIIGFDVNDVEFKQLQCIATETGGEFFRASNASELKDAIASTVAAVSDNGSGNDSAGQGNDSAGKPGEVEPATLLYGKLCETCARLEPLDVNWNVFKAGQQHHQGLGVIYPNDQHQFEPGEYEVAVRLHNSQAIAAGNIEIGEDGKQIDAINLNAGSVLVSSFVNKEDEQAARTALYKFYPIIDGEVGAAIDGSFDNQGQPSETWLNAGTYRATVNIGGNVSDTVDLEIIAGKQISHVFDLRSGVVAPEVFLSEGVKHTIGSSFQKLYESATGAEIIIGRLGQQKPAKPGDYELEISLDSDLGRVIKRFPVTVTAGETITGPFILNATYFDYSGTVDSGVFGTTLFRENKDKTGFNKVDFALGSKGKGLAEPGFYKLEFAPRSGGSFSSEIFEVKVGEQLSIDVKAPQ